jgi:hypothetical protein
LAVRRAQQTSLAWARVVTLGVGSLAVLVGVRWLVGAVPIVWRG